MLSRPFVSIMSLSFRKTLGNLCLLGTIAGLLLSAPYVIDIAEHELGIDSAPGIHYHL